MQSGVAPKLIDSEFDIPPLLVVAERRMAGQAVDRWRAGGGALVECFAENSLTIIDPAGAARIADVGAAVATAFGLVDRMALAGRDGLAAEIRAACDLVTVDSQPVPFDARLSVHGAGQFLVRGVALPIDVQPSGSPTCVQIVVNWREVLDPAATALLRRDLGAELRLVSPELTKIDPFLPESSD
jgi:hypothetical protein